MVTPKVHKVAIVGAGSAGLAAAYALKETDLEVHLYEADRKCGGHAKSHCVENTLPERFNIDIAFAIANPENYPLFTELLRQLDVPTRWVPNSFSVSLNEGGLVWKSSNVFAQPANWFRISFWRMLFDILRFNTFAPDVLNIGTGEAQISETIGEDLQRCKYSSQFRDAYLLPLTASAWSNPLPHCRDQFPIVLLVQFMLNHRLLTIRSGLKWYTIDGGSQKYVEKILKACSTNCQVHTNTPVASIQRKGSAIFVETEDHYHEQFDHVILATSAPRALRMLGDHATAPERKLLSLFKTTENKVYLHTDTKYMPAQRSAWSVYNYMTFGPANSENEAVAVTCYTDLLHGHETDKHRPLLLTMNPPEMYLPSGPWQCWEFDHPQYTTECLLRQPQVAGIQAQHGVSFAGAWLGDGFHEAGIKSGFEAAERLQVAKVRAQRPSQSQSNSVQPRTTHRLLRHSISSVQRLILMALNLKEQLSCSGASDPSTVQAKPKKHVILLCLLTLCAWNLVVAIDNTILTVALPTIARELHATSNQIFWCGTAFALCVTALQPICASFARKVGPKSVILAALTFFTVGAIVCGTAHSIKVMLMGRSLQGVGAGCLTVMTYIVLTNMFTLRERSKYYSVISVTWLVGVAVGPILGGYFAESISWRWNFWLNLPICGVCYILVVFFMPTINEVGHPTTRRLEKIDWMGFTIFIPSLTSFLTAISWGGTMFPWSNWKTVLPLVLGCIGLLFWGLYSHYLTRTPMVPLHILKDRTAVMCFFGTVIHGITQFGMLYYLPLYYQAVKAYSPLISGVALLPQCLGASISAALTGIFIAKTSQIKIAVLIGWLTLASGLCLLQLLDSSTSISAWIFINVPSGIGIGILFTSLMMAIQASVEGRTDIDNLLKPSAISTAAGLIPFFRALGQSLGIVIGQAAFVNEMKRRAGAETARDAMIIAQSIREASSADPELTSSIVGNFMASERAVLWVLFALACSAGGLSMFIRNVSILERGTMPETPTPRIAVAESETQSPISIEDPEKLKVLGMA